MNEKHQDKDRDREMHRFQMRMFRRMLRKHPNARGIALPGLRAARIAEGLSQRDLAQRIGASPRTILELENQRRGAYPKTMSRLSKALGLRPIELTFRTDLIKPIKGDDDHA